MKEKSISRSIRGNNVTETELAVLHVAKADLSLKIRRFRRMKLSVGRWPTLTGSLKSPSQKPIKRSAFGRREGNNSAIPIYFVAIYRGGRRWIER